MIKSAALKDIEKTANEFWNKEVQKESFKERATGKEVGHRMADFIDDQTTGLLVNTYKAAYHRSKKGVNVPRSMGDVWFPSGGIYHPINVKTSITGAKGQPNMVSLKKLLIALLEHRIDSYYLLIVKVSIGDTITCKVHLIDLLDYLDYMTYDAGPGQIMLKAGAFFAARESAAPVVERTLGEKVEKLVEMLEDGDKRLTANRKKIIERLRAKAREYVATEHIVTPETQAMYNLG